MKSIKKVLCLLVVYLIIGASQLSYAKQMYFDYNEAVSIGYGTWKVLETGKYIYPIWVNKAGDSNVVNGKGRTDSLGESVIYFDYKGIPGCLVVEYNANEDLYYGTMIIYPFTDQQQNLYGKKGIIRISSQYVH